MGQGPGFGGDPGLRGDREGENGSFLAAIGTASCAHADAARTDDGITCLAGIYDGGQPEVAAGLALGSDRRFSYGLSYGALDERAEGRWEADRGKVYLTSNPVKAPELVLLGERASPDSLYRIELDLPAGLSRQYFDARIELADGQVVEQQLDEVTGRLVRTLPLG